MKAVRPVIAANGVPYLQMRSIGSHSTSGREKEGKKERTGKSRSNIRGRKRRRRRRSVCLCVTAEDRGKKVISYIMERTPGYICKGEMCSIHEWCLIKSVECGVG